MDSPSSTEIQNTLANLVAEQAALEAESAATTPKRDKAYLETEIKRHADLLSQTRHRERMDEWEAGEARQLELMRVGFEATTDAEARLMAEVSAAQRKNPPPRGHVSAVAVIIANRAKEDGHLRRSLRIGAENQRPTRTPLPPVEKFSMRCEHVGFEWTAFGYYRPIRQNVKVGEVVHFTEVQCEFAVSLFTKRGERQFVFVGDHASRHERRFKKFAIPPKSIDAGKRLAELNDGTAFGEESEPAPKTIDGRPSRTGWLNKITGLAKPERALG